MIRALLAVMCTAALTTQPTDGNYCTLTEEQVEICFQAQEEYDVAASLIAAIIQVESSGNEDARNGTCHGLMQVDEMHKGKENLYEPKDNIMKGTQILLSDYEKADGEIYLALMYYNGVSSAQSRFDRWVEQGGHGYPTNYVRKVMELEKNISKEWYGY